MLYVKGQPVVEVDVKSSIAYGLKDGGNTCLRGKQEVWMKEGFVFTIYHPRKSKKTT